MPGQREEEMLPPWELAHDFSAQWLCADNAVFSKFVTQLSKITFFWRGPLTTKEELREKCIQGTCEDVLGIFWGLSLNYEESAGSSYTQTKKKLWKPDEMNLVWPDKVYLKAQ